MCCCCLFVVPMNEIVERHARNDLTLTGERRRAWPERLIEALLGVLRRHDSESHRLPEIGNAASPS